MSAHQKNPTMNMSQTESNNNNIVEKDLYLNNVKKKPTAQKKEKTTVQSECTGGREGVKREPKKN